MGNLIRRNVSYIALFGLLLSLDGLTKQFLWTHPDNIHHVGLFRFLAGIFLTLWWTAIVLNSRKIESLKSWLFVFWAGAIGNLVDSIDNTVQNPILIANDQAGWLAGTNVADILITTSIFAIIYIIGKDSLKQRKERNLKKGVVNEARY